MDSKGMIFFVASTGEKYLSLVQELVIFNKRLEKNLLREEDVIPS
jgi:hypothetical protein